MNRAGLAVALTVVVVLSASPVAGHGNHIEADPQRSADGTVVVETVRPLVDGFVVLHAPAADGGPGEPIGHTRVSADDGFRRGVEVQMDADAWANWTSGDVWIVYHEDNGAERFDPEEDPALSVFGSITGRSVALERADRDANVLAERSQPQRTSNAIATLGSVSMPTAGYAVLRTESGTDGQIVGVTPLDAGVHENVTVDFEASAFPEDRSTTGLYAQLYAETGGDGEGDGDVDESPAANFSASDELIRAGGEPVSTYFLVQQVDDGEDAGPVVQTPTDGTDGVVTPTMDESTIDESTADETETRSAPGVPSETGSTVGGFGIAQALVAASSVAALLAAARLLGRQR